MSDQSAAEQVFRSWIAGTAIATVDDGLPRWAFLAGHASRDAEVAALQQLNESLVARAAGQSELLTKRAAKEPTTEVLDCGCTMTRGWRCPVHGQP